MAVQRSDTRKASGAGRTTTLEPIGFWSYARADDEAAGNALTDLRLALKRELMQQLGRDVSLFQDVAAIPWGAGWKEEIERAIGRSTFFIPIITPRFIQSTECAREMWLFIERQNALRELHPDLPRQSLIFPILYVDVDGIEPVDAEAFEQVKERQFQDFTELRIDETTSPAVKRWVANVAKELCAVLRYRIAVPLTPEEREAAERLAREAAEARAQADREAEATRARAAAEAEEARKHAEEAAKQAAADATHRAALAAEVTAHDEKRTALAALSMRLDKGLTHSKKEHERREARAARVKQVRAGLGRVARIGAWIAGAIAALFVLMVGYFMVFPPAEPDLANQQAQATGNEATAADVPPKPRFAAESWITAHPWAVYGHCDDPFTFSIDGSTLIAQSTDARERYPINASRSRNDRLVAKGLTLKLIPPASGDASGERRMAIIYPDTQVEVLPCAVIG